MYAYNWVTIVWLLSDYCLTIVWPLFDYCVTIVNIVYCSLRNTNYTNVRIYNLFLFISMNFCFLLFIVYCSLVFLNPINLFFSILFPQPQPQPQPHSSTSFLNLKYEHSLSALPKLRDETSSVSLFSVCP